MENMIAQQHFRRLIESLELVAADYDTQRAALPAFVFLPDEIALTFDSAVRLIDQIADGGLLTSEQTMLLHDLDRLFAENSGSDHLLFWTEDAMQHDEIWRASRSRAREILDSLNQPIHAPRLDWITYLPAKSSE